MAVQTVESIQRLPPFLEGLQKRMLQSLYGTFDGEAQTSPGLLDKPLDLPENRIAGMDPLQQMGLAYAPQMFGSFLPSLQQGLGQIGLGSSALGGATSLIGGAAGSLTDPRTGYKPYMDPYLQDVVSATEADIDREAINQSKALEDRLMRSGTKDAGRGEIARAQLAKNIADTKATKLGGLRSGGFQQAMTNMQTGSKLLGGLGSTLGNVGLTYGQLGRGAGDLSRLGSELGRADLGMLMDLGGFGQRYQQNILDTQRQNYLQGVMEPFTRLQLGQGFLTGMPSMDVASTFKSTVDPSPNPFLSGVGAYTSLRNAGVSA
ncbi:MAG: hypothetical protein CBC24_08135 [Candidatus Pelagibacter sp. TMED64]|jgi:hypothetical protein|nr:MAG: hypothetical protein CBC24_08135 [Candidatus Pelagibacter sp. TMED64]|tara:strand:- start:761 stop:1717 length:957 start_codon:yes stop_codon:yes gene_type:complete